MFNLQNCHMHWGQISLVLAKPICTLEYSNTFVAISDQWEHRWCDDMIWHGVEDVSIYQASDRSQSWACVTWQAAQAGPGCHWPSPEIMLLLSPAHCLEIIGGCCPCHLGQETLHTGTSTWPPCTSHLKLAPQLCSCKITWRGHEVSQHFYILLFIICFARYIPFSLKSTTVYCLVS